jgi:hypothetical protein
MAPEPAERGEGADSPARRRNPWYVALFFGREPLEAGTLQVLGLVSIGLFFENYDIGLVNAAAGRRRLFLGALLGMSLGTMATAVSQTSLQFAAAQMITRAFLLTA